MVRFCEEGVKAGVQLRKNQVEKFVAAGETRGRVSNCQSLGFVPGLFQFGYNSTYCKNWLQTQGIKKAVNPCK